MNNENSKNFADFRRKLELLLADTGESAKRVVSRMADVGLAETKRNTPTDTGYLKGKWIKKPTYKAGNAFIASYTNNTEYAMYVNNGHRLVNRNGETVGYIKGVRMLEQGIDAANRQTQTLFDNEIARVKAKTGF